MSFNKPKDKQETFNQESVEITPKGTTSVKRDEFSQDKSEKRK